MTRLLLTSCAVLTGLWVQGQPELSVTQLSAEDAVQSQTTDHRVLRSGLMLADGDFKTLVFFAAYLPDPGAREDCLGIGLEREEDV